MKTTSLSPLTNTVETPREGGFAGLGNTVEFISEKVDSLRSRLRTALSNIPQADDVTLEMAQSKKELLVLANIPLLSSRELQLNIEEKTVKILASAGARSPFKAFLDKRSRQSAPVKKIIELPCYIDDSATIVTRKGNQLVFSMKKAA